MATPTRIRKPDDLLGEKDVALNELLRLTDELLARTRNVLVERKNDIQHSRGDIQQHKYEAGRLLAELGQIERMVQLATSLRCVALMNWRPSTVSMLTLRRHTESSPNMKIIYGRMFARSTTRTTSYSRRSPELCPAPLLPTRLRSLSGAQARPVHPHPSHPSWSRCYRASGSFVRTRTKKETWSRKNVDASPWIHRPWVAR